MLPNLPTILLALALAADATAVCIGWSLAVGRGAVRRGLGMALAFGVAQAAMSALGHGFGTAMAGVVGSAFQWIAAVVLAGLGVRMLWPKRKDEEIDGSKPLTLWIVGVLAVATSIDALAAGVGLGAITDQPWEATAWIGVVTLLLAVMGLAFGAVVGNRAGTWGERLGGLVLIGLGGKLLLVG